MISGDMKKSVLNGRTIAAVVIVAALIAAIAGGAVMLERMQQKGQEAELAERGEKLKASMWTDENTVFVDDTLYGFDHRMETFLFVGTDNSGSGDSNPENYRGPMADFLLLMVLDHTKNTIGYIQIDRNTVTEVNEVDFKGNVIETRELQICTAHWYGRNPEMCAENTVNAVKAYLGDLENIDGYFVINMDDIGRLNHTVGGVEVTVEDDLDADDPTLTKGKTLVLDDAQAEYFLRARMNVGEGQNAERMVRQRQYMASFFEKVKEKTMENPKFGIELWNMLKDVAVSNMNGNDFSRIAQKLLKGENKGIHTIKGETKLGYILEDGEEHEEFYPDAESLRDEMIDMFSLVPIVEDEDTDAPDDDLGEDDASEDPDDEDEGSGDENEDLDEEDVDDEYEDTDDEDEA